MAIRSSAQYKQYLAIFATSLSSVYFQALSHPLTSTLPSSMWADMNAKGLEERCGLICVISANTCCNACPLNANALPLSSWAHTYINATESACFCLHIYTHVREGRTTRYNHMHMCIRNVYTHIRLTITATQQIILINIFLMQFCWLDELNYTMSY